jgi:hypothetical protein
MKKSLNSSQLSLYRTVTIVGGSRGITDICLLEQAITASGFTVTEIVEGECPNSPDILGRIWAERLNIPVKKMPAEWKNFSAPVLVRTNRFGKPFNALAGFRRNAAMAAYAINGQAVLLWDGRSPGTAEMQALCKQYNIRCWLAYVVKNIIVRQGIM